MTWAPLAIIFWLLTIMCWITTPIVVLFCRSDGDLPGLLRYWQTWDDSCDASQEVLEEAPEFLRYDWHQKYFSYTEEIPGTGRTRVYTVPYPSATWSLKERIQRYCCRCLWLWRNPAYGFAFYLLGRTVDCDSITWPVLEDDHRLGYDQTDKGLDTAWTCKDDRRLSSWIRKSWYLGWKIPPDGHGTMRCMIAARLSLRFGK